MMKRALLAVAFFSAVVASAAPPNKKPVVSEDDERIDGDAIQAVIAHKKKSEKSLAGTVIPQDPFLASLYLYSGTNHDLSFEMKQWLGLMTQGEFESAAHLNAAVMSSIQVRHEAVARAAELYLLWKLDLTQSFTQRLIELWGKPDLQKDTSVILAESIRPKFIDWLQTRRPSLSPQQQDQVMKIKTGDQTKVMDRLILDMKAWVAQRHVARANEILPLLPEGHALAPALAMTVALDLTRANKLKSAARILKQYVEPNFVQKSQPELAAEYALFVGRILYQSGSLDAAEEFYQMIPKGSQRYFQAREELLWVWLRIGDLTRLRGDLETMNLDLFKNEFVPELPVVRAISNLKLCFYNKVVQDLQSFSERYHTVADTIDKALHQTPSPAPARLDNFASNAKRALELRKQENEAVAGLYARSLAAALPAVGKQKYWVELKTAREADVEDANQLLAKEFRRQWQNQKLMLQEAIQKMKFVKVELLSQVREQASAGSPAGALTASLEKQSALKRDGSQTYPYEGVVWADELFQLQAVSQGKCLQRQEAATP